MVLVVAGGATEMLMNIILNIKNPFISYLGLIKQKEIYSFLYIETTLEQSAVINLIKYDIGQKTKGSLFYEIYPIYNGKIDFNYFLSYEEKDKIAYYLSDPDIGDMEILKYKESVGI